MMGAVEMLALSLGLSVCVAGLGLAGGTLVERMSDDPRLRDRVWGMALLLPLLPPVATALLLMTPAPVHEVATLTARPVVVKSIEATTAAPVGVQAVAPSLDPGLIATILLVVAGALILLRMLVLARRARRLSALLKSGQAADTATTELVREVARGLRITAPLVVVSTAATEPLLAGLRSARLVMPVALSGDTALQRAVITHELAHLKRGDHRALWMEELALALLAFNPLAPLLRARRSAAREEACDAVALNRAAAETRRAYAQSLIEALRTRAGSQGPGAVPALTFTGAGRTTAMHRLKAVLTPAAPATRRARIGALLTGVVSLALVGAGSAALAAQREPVMQERPQYSANARFEPDVREPLNGAQVPERLGHRYGEDAAVRAATTSVQASYRAETEAKFQRVSAAEYQRYCASDKPDEAGFCAGVMFGQIDSVGVCTPAGLSDGTSDRGPALNTYVERGKREVARLSPRRDEGAHEYASRAIRAAYPCPASQAEQSTVVAWMPVTIEGRGQLNPGDRMRVTLTDPSGALLAESVIMGDGEVRIPLTEAEFPRLGQGNRTYTLSGAIHRTDGSVQPVSAPTTLRLGAGSQRSARNLTATLDFGG
ncbi:M56 family metallopeptidase [Brevundimonas sp.]|uniref:M56 family metallopeptidase n=1 Tax=Brevundimonas sp. TaxID=1871086 RepID=UPI003F705B6F